MKRDLALEVTRHGRPVTEFEAHANPDDIATLRDILRDWLTSNKWAPGLWGQFEIVVRYQGEMRPRKRVRAV